jgi:hypothetical protein
MKKSFKKKIIVWYMVFSMVLSSVLPLGVPVVNAADISIPIDEELLQSAGIDPNMLGSIQSIYGGGGLPVTDIANFKASIEGVLSTEQLVSLTQAISTKEAAERKTLRSIQNTVFVALKQSFSNFLNTLSYDVATWLASGAKGQTPMFHTDNWGDYLLNVADSAAGDFIERLGANWGSEFNLCNPSSLNLKISIGLGLADIQRPRQPNCTFSELVNNWESTINDPNFLDRFQVAFDPRQNDLGIAFTMFDKFYSEKDLAEKIGTKDREEGEGWKAVTEKISGFLKTPASLVKARAEDLSRDAILQEWQKVSYGDIVVDAVQTFASTLAGNLFQRLFTEGLAALSGGDEDGNSENARRFPNLAALLNRQQGQDLYSGEGGAQGALDEAGSRLRFIDFLTFGQSEIKPYDVLTSFASCPDAGNPGPEECVLTPGFRVAIDRELTLEEAINQGFINGDAPFGIRSGSIYDGIPHRSILILRTHRVIPVSWEIASDIIQDSLDPATNNLNTVSLNQLIKQYDTPESPYYKLIDKNWLLKLPQHFCRARGFGEKVLFDELAGGVDFNNDGKFDGEGEVAPSRLVGRAEYCADYQSCIDHNDDGSCNYFGYCFEERRVWDLAASSCSPEYSSCQTFQNSAGQLFSYLKNTLDFSDCSADSAGCRWYCTDFSAPSNSWTCLPGGQDIAASCNSTNGCDISDSCSIALGDSSCTVVTPDGLLSSSLTISETCSTGSQWYDQSSGECNVSVSCKVPNGGINCSINSCDSLPNSLVNGGFEDGLQLTPENQEYIADGWFVPTPSDKAYFDRVSGTGGNFIRSGSNSLRFFTYGAPLSKIIRSDEISLSAGNYTFSTYILDRLNAGGGSVIAKVMSSSGTELGSISPSIKNKWQSRVVDFNLAADSIVYIEITMNSNGGTLSGAVWFDDFKISQSCVSAVASLSMPGASSRDESKLHVDNDVESCPAGAAGCSEFIRVKEDLGANLVPNGGFETWSATPENRGWNATGQVKQVQTGALFSNSSIEMEPGSTLSTRSIAGIRVGVKYLVSFWAKSLSGDASNFAVSLIFDTPTISGAEQFLSGTGITLTSDLRKFEYEIEAPLIGSNFNLKFNNPAGNPAVLIDAVQVETLGFRGVATSYKEYGSVNKINLKKPPAYLGCTGDYINDPTECFDYALYCQPDEVGCQAYQPIAGGISVPGVATQYDYCPLECVGYEAYYQSTSHFESEEYLSYFIPKTARQCSAAQVGCTEFTNLDEVARGGEGREYYQYLRQCTKPDDSCATYFSWQGSNETGYQLVTYVLSADTDGSPRVNISNPDDMPEAWRINSCSGPEDLVSNPFCREFFDSDGTAHYEILLNTVSCSNECVPFRKTSFGESDADDNCIGTGGSWDGQACIYNAIPGEGIGCSAEAAGCREFRGNTGGNIFTAFSDNFEFAGTSATGWSYGQVVQESLRVGGSSLMAEMNGEYKIETSVAESTICNDNHPGYEQATRRCKVTDPLSNRECFMNVGDSYCGALDDSVANSGTFVMSFWAKSIATGTGVNSIADANLEVRICEGELNNPTCKTIDNVRAVSNEWNYFLVGPFDYTANPSARISIVSKAIGGISPNFYVDNIELKQVNKYVYVIKNSWNTPVSCDTNPFTDPQSSAPQFMLGCQQYRDPQNVTHNLKSFSKLCRADAVGCEALIDTHNSTSPFAQAFNEGDAVSQIDVPADSLVFMTNRQEFSCAPEMKGCQAVGLPTINREDEVTGYQTQYLINNPDRYNTILCGSNNVWCEEYSTDSGFYYFKNPRDKTCEYREGRAKFFISIGGQTEEVLGDLKFQWFITGTDTLCPTFLPALGEERPTSYPSGQPSTKNGYVGLCPGGESGCSQFIDPVSTQSKNELINGSFTQRIGNSDYLGWISSGSIHSQEVQLREGSAYTLGFARKEGNTDSLSQDFKISMECPGSVISSPDNTLRIIVDEAQLDTIVYTDEDRHLEDSSGFKIDEASYSGLVAIKSSANNFVCNVRVENLVNNEAKIGEVYLREAQVEYSLAQTVDKISCNGIVDPTVGCVMFNDRSQINYSLGEDDITSLIFDANASGPNINNGIANIDCAGNCNTNSVLKVKANRVCDSWLTCLNRAQSAIDNQDSPGLCLDIGLCSKLDEKGNCIRQEVIDLTTRTSVNQDPEIIKNLSGYATPGYKYEYDSESGLSVSAEGFYNYAEMEQLGGITQVANGDFEQTVGLSVKPVGWSLDNNDDVVGWRDYKFRTVSGVESKMPTAPEGNSFLRVNSFYQVRSEEIDVERGENYRFSIWLNTLNLKDSLTGGSPSARVCIVAASGDQTIDGQPVIAGNECPISVNSGLDWQEKDISFVVPGNINSIRIVLKNVSSVPGENCDNYLPGKIGETCTLSGFSGFDDVLIAPVLEASEDDYISRDCRMYPTTDSLSCRISSSNIINVGQYGYCLVKDPANPKQCLQWWPVDQIKGGAPDAFSGYSDRSPLYYCLEKDVVEIKFGGSNTLARFNSGRVADSDYGGLMEFDSGVGTHFIPFNIPPEYQVFFRWPYVKKVNFFGIMGAAGTGISGGAVVYAEMLPRMASVYGGGFTTAGFLLVVPRPWMGFNPLSGFIEQISETEASQTNPADPISGCDINQPNYDQCVADALEALGGGGCEGLSCFIEDIRDAIQGALEDALQIVADIIGTIFDVVYLTEDDIWGGWGISFMVLGEYAVGLPIPWHTALDMSGGGGSLVSTVIDLVADTGFINAGTFGTKIVTDIQYSGSVDPVPDIPGDITGAVWFLDSASHQNSLGSAVIGTFNGKFHVQYCKKLVQVVTSAGSNKAWSGRVSEGSGYTLTETINDYNILALNPRQESFTASYFYEKPFIYEEAIDKWEKNEQYPYSDYKPFGSLVPPSDALEPEQWDSRPPRTVFRAPHQARMGQLHQTPNLADLNNNAGLAKIFIKSYGVWNWTTEDSEGDDLTKSAHRYVKQPAEGWDLLETWGETEGYCATRTGNAVCRIRPEVTNIKINDKNDASGENLSGKRAMTIKLSFNTKIDVEQEPLRSYVVDWGDGDRVTVSGANLLNKTNEENPYVLYHVYDYWKMIQNGSCTTSPCNVKVKIRLKDNWNAETCIPRDPSVSLADYNTACANDVSKRFIPMQGTITLTP